MTHVMNVNARWGMWLIDTPGTGMARQSFDVQIAGRATRLVQRCGDRAGGGALLGRVRPDSRALGIAVRDRCEGGSGRVRDRPSGSCRARSSIRLACLG